MYRTYDAAGMLEATEFDFKGNLLSQTRRFASDFKTRPDWIALASATDPSTIGASGIRVDVAAGPETRR